MKEKMEIPKSWDAIEVRCVANGWLVNANRDYRNDVQMTNEIRAYHTLDALTTAIGVWASAKWVA